VAQGAIIGCSGAVVAVIVLAVVSGVFRAPVEAALSGLATAGDVRFLNLAEAIGLVASGLGLGAVAGVVATRSVR
jgi:cell division protein FtsX